MARLTVPFAALVAAQAAHSIEEYAGRLWESFPPAAYLTGLVFADRELGFIIINGALVAFGVWCLLWPVRKAWASAATFAWIWVVIETINGIGHPLWSLRQGVYTPGTLTAPILLVLALYLARQLVRDRREREATAG
jgi:hypothetical protein